MISIIFHDVDIKVSFVSFLEILIMRCYFLIGSCYSFLFVCVFVGA